MFTTQTIAEQKTEFQTLFNGLLPDFYNVKRILKQLTPLDNNADVHNLLMEVEYAGLFAVKELVAFSSNYKMLEPQYGATLARAERITTEASIIISDEIYFFHFNERSASQKPDYIFKHLIGTHLQLDILAAMMVENSSMESTYNSANESQRLLIKALDAVTYIRGIRMKFTPSTTPPTTEPIWSQHRKFLMSYLSHSMDERGYFSAERIKALLNSCDDDAKTPEMNINLLTNLTFQLLNTLLSIYNDTMGDISHDAKVVEKSVLSSDEHNYISKTYLNNDNIFKICMVFRNIQNQKQKAKALIQFGLKLRYYIDALCYQYHLLKSDAQEIHPYFSLKNLPIMQDSEATLDKISYSIFSRPDSVIDYTTNDKAKAAALNHNLALIQAGKKSLYRSDQGHHVIYYTASSELACVSVDAFRLWILNNEFAALFFRKEVIYKELNKYPGVISRLIQDLFFVSTCIMYSIDRLSNGLISNKITMLQMSPPDLCEVIVFHDPYGVKKKLVMVTAERAGKPDDHTQKMALEKYFNFDAFSDYLNPLVEKPVGAVLFQLSKFFLEASNIYRQLDLLMVPLAATHNPVSVYIYAHTLKERISQIKYQFANKAWHELMAPIPNQLMEMTSRLLTKAPEKLPAKPKKLLPASTSVEEKKSDSAPVSTPLIIEDEKKSLTSTTPTNIFTGAGKKSVPTSVAIKDPALLHKESLARLEENLASLGEQLRVLSTVIQQLREDFRKQFSKDSARQSSLGEDIFETLPYAWRGARNALERFDLSNPEEVRQQSNSLNLQFSTLKYLAQTTRQKLEHEIFVLNNISRQKKGVEEKKNPQKEEKRERPKPKPVNHSTAAAPKLSAKPPQPANTVYSGDSAFTARAPIRIMHLNQACKNLIFIRKILDCHANEIIKPEIAHFSLLYNIFRCFQSLKMYQSSGGRTHTIDQDEVIDLRNMLIHHGASAAQSQEVFAFANSMVSTMPQTFLELTNKIILKHELSNTQRQEIISTFNLLDTPRPSLWTDHAKLVLSDKPLFLSLRDFHMRKTDNNGDFEDFVKLIEFYIPAIKRIGTPLFAKRMECSSQQFVEAVLFELQALRMLVTICGELGGQFTRGGRSTTTKFLNYCHSYVRNTVAHHSTDTDCYDAYDTFVHSLRKELSTIKTQANSVFSQPFDYASTSDSDVSDFTPSL